MLSIEELKRASKMTSGQKEKLVINTLEEYKLDKEVWPLYEELKKKEDPRGIRTNDKILGKARAKLLSNLWRKKRDELDKSETILEKTELKKMEDKLLELRFASNLADSIIPDYNYFD